jgi:hypothetical protein
MLLTDSGLHLAAFDTAMANLLGNNPAESGWHVLMEAGRHRHRRVELWDWFYLLLRAPTRTAVRQEFVEALGMDVAEFITHTEAAFDLPESFAGSPPWDLLPATVSPDVLQMLDRAETLARDHHCPRLCLKTAF